MSSYINDKILNPYGFQRHSKLIKDNTPDCTPVQEEITTQTSILNGERLGNISLITDSPVFPKNHFELSHTITKPK